MPASVVKTKKDEERWDRAKEKAEEAGHKENWPYVMSIFQRMKGKTASIDRIVGLWRKACGDSTRLRANFPVVRDLPDEDLQ